MKGVTNASNYSRGMPIFLRDLQPVIIDSCGIVRGSSDFSCRLPCNHVCSNSAFTVLITEFVMFGSDFS